VYERPLLTIDGSELALLALPHAARVIEEGGTVLVLEVLDPKDYVDFQEADDGSDRNAEEIVAAMEVQAREHLDAATAALEALGAGEVTPVIRVGEAGIEILRAVEEHGCDIVVMSSQGRGGLARAVIGSVTDYVERHIESVPVLVVPARKADDGSGG
jgi:nucleotide-binding universal stress UspA family protein